MTPTDAIDWCIRRNADAPTCARLREILPQVAAADATNRALLERCADLEKEVARLRGIASDLWDDSQKMAIELQSRRDYMKGQQ